MSLLLSLSFGLGTVNFNFNKKYLAILNPNIVIQNVKTKLRIKEDHGSPILFGVNDSKEGTAEKIIRRGNLRIHFHQGPTSYLLTGVSQKYENKIVPAIAPVIPILLNAV